MKKIYIFGSGASKCAGLPIVDDAMELIMNERKAALILNEDWGKGGSGDIKYRKIKDKYSEFIASTDFEKNIEGFLLWLERLQINQKIENLNFVVYWYFWDRARNLKIPRFYHIFVKQILQPGDVVISFNYDLFLERAFNEKDDDKKNKKERKYTYIPSRTVKRNMLLKLNGSVNWGFAKDEGIAEQLRSMNRKILDMNAKLFVVEYNEDGSIKPAMKWFKTFTDCDFKTKIFKTAKKAINDPDYEIISLGYAFPQDDSEILSQIFERYCGRIEVVCGKKFSAPWSNKIQYENTRKTFEEWVLDQID